MGSFKVVEEAGGVACASCTSNDVVLLTVMPISPKHAKERYEYGCTSCGDTFTV
ncbi:MAG: hypothetical protein HYS81_02940 [Candidatus Aenigmatarchaeota archaeon]|nr:MAG: hypothetical protein HYS81_02940 [Candidatus Aenigmarchaeota archaeon]